jgi:hypothetical protein
MDGTVDVMELLYCIQKDVDEYSTVSYPEDVGEMSMSMSCSAVCVLYCTVRYREQEDVMELSKKVPRRLSSPVCQGGRKPT